MLFFNNSEAQIPVLSETQLDHDCFFISFKRITDMAFRFTPEDFEKIAQALGVSARTEGNMTRFELKDADTGRKLALEIHPDIQVPDADAMSLVSVYAANSFLQLQSCTGYVASEDLGEVIFFAKQNGTTNGLVVERGAGCSLYANVDDRLLSADFARLPSEVMMCSVALSMTEDLFS